ncbi:MTP18 multi-domain protein [Pyrenophora tritici-repentis]|nr:MTP18 multi-domain protein [Pyrenophora tritici-repentis]KAI0610758.1 MTP18 multi-domain protein [Pyrenophora tritici-repentis]KAI0623427.1 MTP18 multi-domain protein [Pyrenophora tritici-repentis]KAI2483140.1 MTP18 multi-domain protein [Pyrenophora tritici-repentis]
MAKDDTRKVGEIDGVPAERKGVRPDFSTPPPRKALPKEIQDTLNDDEKMWEIVYDGEGEDTTETNLRYAAYASRIRTIMLSAHRYVAYTSDIGESFRPIAHPYLVKGAYGISWLYLMGDVSHEGYKAYVRNQRILHPENYMDETADKMLAPSQNQDLAATGKGSGIFDKVQELARNAKSTEGVKYGDAGTALTGGKVVAGKIPAIEDYRAVMAQRAVFQAVASMGLPAFTIHSIVRYSGRALKDAKNKTLRTWGPIGLGLAAVPFLPYMFDEPVEHATEWIFYNAFKAIGGEKAVEGRPVTGAKELRKEETESNKLKKEL